VLLLMTTSAISFFEKKYLAMNWLSKLGPLIGQRPTGAGLSLVNIGTFSQCLVLCYQLPETNMRILKKLDFQKLEWVKKLDWKIVFSLVVLTSKTIEFNLINLFLKSFINVPAENTVETFYLNAILSMPCQFSTNW